MTISTMKRMISALLCAMMILISALPAWAQGVATPSEPEPQPTMSAETAQDVVKVTMGNCAGKRVSVRLYINEQTYTYEAATDNGVAVFEGVAAGNYLVWAKHEGMSAALTRQIAVEGKQPEPEPESEPEPVPVTASASASGSTVTLTVSGSDGKTLTAALADKSAAVSGGVAVFEGVAAGTYEIAIVDETGAGVATCTVTVEEAQQPQEPEPVPVTASASASGSTVTVTVSGSDGKTLTAALADKSAAVSGGVAVFEGVAAGTYEIAIVDETGAGVATCTVTVEEAQQPQEPEPVPVTASASASGSTVTVNVSGSDGKTLTAALADKSAAVSGGVAVFEGVAAGFYEIIIMDETGAGVATCTVTVEETQQPQQPEQTVTASASAEGSTVTVTVTGGDGLTLTAELGSMTAGVTGGQAVFGGVADGTYTVTIKDAEGKALAACDVTVAASEPKPAVTASAVAEGGKVTVTVTSAEGRTLKAMLGSMTAAVTNGVAVFENVPAGSYEVVIVDEAGAAIASQIVTVTGSQPEQAINVSAVAEGGKVTVTVTSAEGRTLKAMLGSMTAAVTNGVAVFENVPAGSYEVVIVDEAGAKAASCIVTVENQTPAMQLVTLMALPATKGVGGGSITGKVSMLGVQGVVQLVDATGAALQTIRLGADGVFTFNGLATGVYTVNFYNAADMSIVLLTFQQTVEEKPATAGVIDAAATTGINRIDVIVSQASKLPVVVTLLTLDGQAVAAQEIAGGVGNAAFTNVAAGTYNVSVAYKEERGIPATMIGSLTVADAPKGITITGVTGGEGKLVVTGTAQPDKNITLTTAPASATTVVRSDAKGNFSANLICGAGVYTAVTAKYDGGEGAVTCTGSFTVTGTAVKPQLAVDTIDINSRTVIAKTTPGVLVKLTTPDYTQSAVADANGLVHFSLPHTYLQGQVFTLTVYYGAGNALSYDHTGEVVGPMYYELLKLGCYGDDVLRLTQRLHDLGYPITPTKNYDEAVRSAVRVFQGECGIDLDGIAGQQTLTLLYSVSAPRYNEEYTYPTFIRGDRGRSLIYLLQQRLKELGYYYLRVDGIFGSGTQRAVRMFQSVNGLTVSGAADNATQKLLHSSAAKANPGGCWYGDYGTLKRSSRYNPAVVPLQRRLKNLGYLNGAVDGYFGSITQRAVRNFQKRNGITVTGVADPYTQEVLYSSSARPAGSGSVSSGSTVTGYKLLYWGCTGSYVKRLQNALIDAGYKSIVRSADGIYGKWTYDAVRAYQKDHGLAVDGIAGKDTQNSLYGTNY